MPPWSALPEHLNSPEKWKGTDNDTWYMRWSLKIKGWFAFGPRATEWWAKWRETPKILLAIKGNGFWRSETSNGQHEYISETIRAISWPVWILMAQYNTWHQEHVLLSRVQYYTRWHFAVQWPLQVTFHIYWRAKDVPTYPNKPKGLGISKLLFLYGPTHRDADNVYWLGSFYIGGQWK